MMGRKFYYFYFLFLWNELMKQIDIEKDKIKTNIREKEQLSVKLLLEKT